MTKLQQAYRYIENLQIAEFFAFLKSNAKPNEMLTRLEKTFVLGKTDADFYEQLKSIANLLLSPDKAQIHKMIIDLGYKSYLLGYILHSNITIDLTVSGAIDEYNREITDAVNYLNLDRDITKAEHENIRNYKKKLSNRNQKMLDFGINVAILQTFIYSLPHLKDPSQLKKMQEHYRKIVHEIKDFFITEDRARLTYLIPDVNSKDENCYKIIQEYISTI
jgi:hypothetical protein